MWNDLIRLSQYTIKASDLEKDEIVKAKCYLRDLSLLYFQRNENTKAKEIIAKGLNIARRISNNNLLAYGYLRSGMILLQEKKYRKSLSYLEKSLELFSMLNEGARVGECLCYLSNCYLKLQKHKLAKQTGEKAFKICTINNHKRCQADALSYLAEIYISEKDYNYAKRLLLQSIKIDNQIMRKGQIWIYNTAALSFIEHMIGSSKKAKIYYEDFQQNNKVVNLSWRVEDLLNYYTDTQS